MSEALAQEVEKINLQIYGERILGPDQDPFTQNAWDRFEWTPELEKDAKHALTCQKESQLIPLDQLKYADDKQSKYWDKFYSLNEGKFFKERHWILREFPSISTQVQPEETLVFMEIGCGTGATVFPLLEEVENIFVHACDLSKVAIDLVKGHANFTSKKVNAFVFDLTSDTPPPIERHSVDVLSLIFVLSALNPKTWTNAMRNLNYVLKSGGRVIMRDYGRYDMTQLRFKPERILEDNFYIRGDSTRVYFFDTDEIAELFKEFKVEQNTVDRKLIVNRHRKIRMYRHWVQGQFIKK